MFNPVAMSSLALVQLNVFCFDTRSIPEDSCFERKWMDETETNNKFLKSHKKKGKISGKQKMEGLVSRCGWRNGMLVGPGLVASGHLGLGCAGQP